MTTIKRTYTWVCDNHGPDGTPETGPAIMEGESVVGDEWFETEEEARFAGQRHWQRCGAGLFDRLIQHHDEVVA